jgi:hypothetical protein
MCVTLKRKSVNIQSIALNSIFKKPHANWKKNTKCIYLLITRNFKEQFQDGVRTLS